MKRDSRAPLIVAIVLLLLPVLYVGSYFALVVPGGIPERTAKYRRCLLEVRQAIPIR
jgi:hypothetical protein